jgi:hypothetical protein
VGSRSTQEHQGIAKPLLKLPRNVRGKRQSHALALANAFDLPAGDLTIRANGGDLVKKGRSHLASDCASHSVVDHDDKNVTWLEGQPHHGSPNHKDQDFCNKFHGASILPPSELAGE